MADLVHVALRYGHILFGLMWVGTILVMTLVVYPRVGTWAPGPQRVFHRSITDRLFVYAEGSAILTILLGLGLYHHLFRIETLGSMSPHASIFLAALVLSLTITGMAIGFIFPRLRRASAIMDQLPEDAPPPPEVERLMVLPSQLSNVAVVLSLVVLALMVGGVTHAYL